MNTQQERKQQTTNSIHEDAEARRGEQANKKCLRDGEPRNEKLKSQALA